MSNVPSVSIPDPPTTDTPLAVDRVREFVTKCLVKKGMFRVEAEMVAARTLDADLFGLAEFGACCLPKRIERIEAGDIDPRGQTQVVYKSDSIAVLDGGTNFGEVGLTRAISLAAERARNGLKGVVLVGNSRAVESIQPAAIYAVQQGFDVIVSSSGISEKETNDLSRPSLVFAKNASTPNPGTVSLANSGSAVCLYALSRRRISLDSGPVAELLSGSCSQFLKPFVSGIDGQLNVSLLMELVPQPGSEVTGSEVSRPLSDRFELLAASLNDPFDMLSGAETRARNLDPLSIGVSYPAVVLADWHKLALKLKVSPPWTPAAT